MSFKTKMTLFLSIVYIITIIICQEQPMTVYVCLTALFAAGVLPPLLRKPQYRRRSPKERRQWTR